MKMNENMKSILKTVASLSVLLLAASCTMEQIDTQMTPEKAKASIRLECSALESYTVQAAKPQDISFHVSATTPWTITGKDADWLTVTPASSSVSSLSEDIRITAKANNDFADRKAVLTVSGQDTETSYTITVTQLRKGKLAVAAIADKYEPTGGSKTFTVQSNIAWEASAADEWLTLNPASGSSDGETKSFTITATAAENSSVTRSTTVTVAAGDEKQEFEVIQRGQTLEILPVASTEVDRRGEELVLDVDATMDWKVECDTPGVIATKAGNDKINLSVPFNSIFLPRTIKVTIKPTTAAYGDVSSSVEFTQDINFTFEGDYEVQDDGSVMLVEGESSHIVLKDGMRYGTLKLTFGEVHFAEKGDLWYVNDVADGDAWAAHLYNWLTVGKTRLRAEGSISTGHGLRIDKDSYMSESYDISLDELNAMTTYEMDLYPDPENKEHLCMDFLYNGSKRCSAKCMNPFYGNDLVGNKTYVGVYTGSTTDDTWFEVKSCEVTVIED